MNSRNITVAGAFLIASAAAGVAQSAWLPAANQFKATPGFSYSSFDEFWAGKTKVENPPKDAFSSPGESLDQYTGYVTLEYGILANLAFDATIGYTATDTDAFGPDASDDGLADTTIGLRYRLLDEQRTSSRWVPTLSLRVGAIIAGTYDENLPFSAGDGAHGVEGSILFGKAFGNSGFGIYGDIGYRLREGSVPEDVFGSAGAFQQIGPVTFAFGYRHVQGLSGPDIVGPGTVFPLVKEINQLIEGGISFTDKGGRNYQFSVAKSVDGRNTGDKLIFGVNVTLPFGGN